jgi:hypothetical protein
MELEAGRACCGRPGRSTHSKFFKKLERRGLESHQFLMENVDHCLVLIVGPQLILDEPQSLIAFLINILWQFFCPVLKNNLFNLKAVSSYRLRIPLESKGPLPNYTIAMYNSVILLIQRRIIVSWKTERERQKRSLLSLSLEMISYIDKIRHVSIIRDLFFCSHAFLFNFNYPISSGGSKQ